MKKYLAIVDPQNDFIDGSMAVGLDKWAPAYDYILGLMKANDYDAVLMTKDWHPEDHCSFTPQGGPWPEHCVAGTQGAAAYDGLEAVADKVILKGRDAAREEYGVDLLAEEPDDNVEIDVVGLCYDYCVANCAKQTSEAHPAAKVTVHAQGCVAIDPQAVPDFGKATVI